MASVTGQLPAVNSRPVAWPAIAWFTALVIIAYVPMLRLLVYQWSTDEDVGHGFFVPVVAAYIAWQRRDELLSMTWKPAWWGALIMLWGIVQSYIGTLGA